MFDCQHLITEEVMSDKISDMMTKKPDISIKLKSHNVTHRIIFHQISNNLIIGSNKVESVLNLALLGIMYLDAQKMGFDASLRILAMAHVPEDVINQMLQHLGAINSLSKVKKEKGIKHEEDTNSTDNDPDDDILDTLM